VKSLAQAVAQDEGVDPNTVRINYFQTGSADTAALTSWFYQQQTAAQDGQGQFCRYFVGGHNCGTFAAQGLAVGHAISAAQANSLSLDPNRMFQQLSSWANDNFDLLRMQTNPPTKACVTTYGQDGPYTTC
jgi:hypothetical protein